MRSESLTVSNEEVNENLQPLEYVENRFEENDDTVTDKKKYS